MQRPHRVLFDGEAFLRHRRSGITRYFAELIAQYRTSPTLGVEAITPYKYVANAHLAASAPHQFRQIPLPSRYRHPILETLNARRAKRAPVPDLVHHSLYELSALNAIQAPRVCTVYDFTFELRPDLFPGQEAALRDKRVFLERCDLLLCISQTTYDDLQRVHPDLDKPAVVTPLGVSQHFLAPTPVSIRGLPERYLLHVGNRHVHKNVDVLLRAFAEIVRLDPSLRLVLSGQGLPNETARLRELGIEDRVVFLSATDEQLPWLYHRAQAFVFPSLYEGFGLPVLEAMAAGCPVVIAATPALVEVAGDDASIFAPDDVDSLVALLQDVIGDPIRAKSMRETGARRAATYTWRRTAELTASAYDQARQLPRSSHG